MNTARAFRELLSSWETREDDDFCLRINDFLGVSDAAWEFGPDPRDDDRMLFSISLRNDPEWTAHVSEVLGIPFQQGDIGATVGIPPRQWDRYFECVDRNNIVQEIDGESWSFSMSPSDDQNMVRLRIFADLPETVDWFETVSVMLTGELGESNVSAGIAHVDRAFEPDGLSAFAHLRSAFVHYFPKCHFREALLLE